MRARWLWVLVVPIAAMRSVACSSSPSGSDAGDAQTESGVIQPAPQQGLRWALELGHGAFARGLGVDGDGNIWIGGRFGAPTLDIGSITVPCAATHCAFVAKISPSGDALLAKAIGQGDSDVAALTASQSAVFVAVDQTAVADAGPLAAAAHTVLELDLQGQLVDARTTKLPSDTGYRATQLVGDPGAGLYYFSEMVGNPNVHIGTLDGSVSDLDAGGAGFMIRTFGANAFEWGVAMGATPINLFTSKGASGLLVTGDFPTNENQPAEIGAAIFDAGRGRGLLAHVDPNGAAAYLDDFGPANPRGAVALASGHVIVVGDVKGQVALGGTNLTDAGSYKSQQAFWAEVDSSGAPLGAKVFPTSVYGTLEGVVATDDGGTFAKGDGILFTSQGRVEGDLLVVRLDAQGNVLWSRGGWSPVDTRSFIASTSSGPIVVATSLGALDLSPILTDVRDAGDAAIFIAALQP